MHTSWLGVLVLTSGDCCGRLLIPDGCGGVDASVGCGPYMQNNNNNNKNSKLKLQWIKNYENKLKKKVS